MKIGILGTGNMGRTLGVRWAQAGHAVVFGARNPEQARAAAAAVDARAGSLDEAAAFGDVLLYTTRGVPPAQLLTEPGRLDGKIVIDCNNSEYAGDGEFDPPPVPSYAEQLALAAPRALVVQAFSTLPHRVLEQPRAVLAPRRISAFVASDHAEAKRVVSSLAEDLGLVAIDSGELRRARFVDGLVDFIRFQIAAMGLGPLTTISLDRLPEQP